MSAQKQDYEHSPSTDPHELAKFRDMAEDWWDLEGKFKPLHRLNPTRVAYIKQAIVRHNGRDQDRALPLDQVSILDVGCGGGLLCEPMARLGATVTGVDAVAKNIEIAKYHAEASGLEIDYRAQSVESLYAEQTRFDVVTALEIVEHVVDPQSFLQACIRMLKPDGILIVSTLNRSVKSYALAIVAAEYILGWLPKGTHDWEKFVKPHELKRWIKNAAIDLDRPDFEVSDTTGMSFNPLRQSWSLGTDLDVNFIQTAKQI